MATRRKERESEDESAKSNSGGRTGADLEADRAAAPGGSECNYTYKGTAIVPHPENINETDNRRVEQNMHELLFLSCQTGCEERDAAGCSSQDAAKIACDSQFSHMNKSDN
ncbi:hypothetical protein T07_2624 [Trichinella nelsoni]|uniref:Uncharacterized protein n=1 Tax=Trichinella nelsoni TaxID=6336 RepID=A0A0V0S484_9BILA|nr:hypothetical protein T07_2624 [Trichinella nelsoni]